MKVMMNQFAARNVPSSVGKYRVIRSLAISAGAGLVCLVILAIGLESVRQVDPVRMRGRAIAKLFGHTIFIGGEAPLEFAIRFPRAVQDRPPSGWYPMREWSLLGSPRFQSRPKRLLSEATDFLAMPELLGMPSEDADRFAARIIDLVAAGTEFAVMIDDDELGLQLETADGTVVEKWRR